MATNDSTNNTLFGATSGSAGAAGYVGEVISSNIAGASAISLSNNTPTNVTSISLTAGDWDVFGNSYFIANTTTTVSSCFVGMNTVSATLPDRSLQAPFQTTFTTGGAQGINAPNQRINVSSTTTVYLVVQATFGVSTMTVCGNLYARRTR